MPRLLVVVTLLFAQMGCSPSQFAWNDNAAARPESYRAAFAAAAGDAIVATASRSDFLDLLARERVLWLGDNHHSSRLHALHLELLSQLQTRGAKLVLALEAIGVEDQANVDAYLSGALTMEHLRQRLRERWSGSWLDDLDLDSFYYRTLLLLAKDRQLPVCALEPTPRRPLLERDSLMAAAVQAAAARYSDRMLVVIVGQSHLGGASTLVRDAGLGGMIVGAQLVPNLRRQVATDLPRGTLLQSNGKLWWFAEMAVVGG